MGLITVHVGGADFLLTVKEAEDLVAQVRTAIHAGSSACPHPFDRRIVDTGGDVFYERTGCLDCDTWFTQVKRCK